MDTPYRYMEPKDDVVNTRLETLEVANVWSKRSLHCVYAVLGILVVGFGCILVDSACRVRNEKDACHSMVKSQPVTPGMTLSCDHHNQKMTIVGTGTIECECR